MEEIYLQIKIVNTLFERFKNSKLIGIYSIPYKAQSQPNSRIHSLIIIH